MKTATLETEISYDRKKETEDISQKDFYFEANIKRIYPTNQPGKDLPEANSRPKVITGYLSTTNIDECLDQLASDEIFNNLPLTQISIYTGESNTDSKEYLSSRDVTELPIETNSQKSYEIASYRNVYTKERKPRSSRVIFNGSRNL